MKLSQGLKDRMTILILAAKFDAEEATIKQQYKELGDDIYNAIDGIGKLAKLPANWFPCNDYISCGFNGQWDYVPMTAVRPLPFVINQNRQSFGADHEFTVRFIEYQESLSNFRERCKEVRRELEGVLKGVNTDKQLLAIWPEAIKWLPSSPVPVPVVQSVDRLKSLLGDLG